MWTVAGCAQCPEWAQSQPGPGGVPRGRGCRSLWPGTRCFSTRMRTALLAPVLALWLGDVGAPASLAFGGPKGAQAPL